MSLEETKIDLFVDLGIERERHIDSLETLVSGDSRYVRDLRINLKNVLNSDNLKQQEAYLLALSVAANEKNDLLIGVFSDKARESGAEEAAIAESLACASLLATNNVFYRFKHFIKPGNENYQALPARIKMNIMARPVLGKELFELMSLAISAINGCEACVNAHEASVRRLGASEARIFDAVRLASVVRGLALVVR
jgi:alkyl hydroperoxide reductase subunit D